MCVRVFQLHLNISRLFNLLLKLPRKPHEAYSYFYELDAGRRNDFKVWWKLCQSLMVLVYP